AARAGDAAGRYEQPCAERPSDGRVVPDRMGATPGLDAPGNRRIPLQRVTLARDQRSNPRAGRRRLGARRARDGRLRVRQRGSRDADVLRAADARGGGELPARGRELRPDRSGGPRQTGKPVRGRSPRTGFHRRYPTSLLVVAVALAVVVAVGLAVV